MTGQFYLDRASAVIYASNTFSKGREMPTLGESHYGAGLIAGEKAAHREELNSLANLYVLVTSEFRTPAEKLATMQECIEKRTKEIIR